MSKQLMILNEYEGFHEASLSDVKKSVVAYPKTLADTVTRGLIGSEMVMGSPECVAAAYRQYKYFGNELGSYSGVYDSYQPAIEEPDEIPLTGMIEVIIGAVNPPRYMAGNFLILPTGTRHRAGLIDLKRNLKRWFEKSSRWSISHAREQVPPVIRVYQEKLERKADEAYWKEWEEGLREAHRNRELMSTLMAENWVGLEILSWIREFNNNEGATIADLISVTKLDFNIVTMLLVRFVKFGVVDENEAKYFCTEEGIEILENLERKSGLTLKPEAEEVEIGSGA